MTGVSKCSELLEITLRGFAYAMITERLSAGTQGLCVAGTCQQVGISDTIRYHCPCSGWQRFGKVSLSDSACIFFSCSHAWGDAYLQRSDSRSGDQSRAGARHLLLHPAAPLRSSWAAHCRAQHQKPAAAAEQSWAELERQSP